VTDKARNSKYEIRNKSETRKRQRSSKEEAVLTARLLELLFLRRFFSRACRFGFVSDFEFRISDLPPICIGFRFSDFGFASDLTTFRQVRRNPHG